MSRALILVGHGSHLNADSSAPVYAHAARLRASGAFDEVVEAFWKEEPSLRDALDLVESPEVFVVPLFLAEGYFTRQVLPRELGLDGPVTARGGQTIHYLPPVGTHPAMADLVARRVRETAPVEPGEPPPALVVIGHGTDRSATSGDTVYALVDRLRERNEFSSVTCGFLDEEPRIASVLELVSEKQVVLVPFFVAEGWHTRETIPAELGLAGELTIRYGRTIRYTPPVGTFPEVAELILEIVGDAVSSGHPRDLHSLRGSEHAIAAGDPGAPLLPAARDAFFAWLRAAPRRTFLQLLIEPHANRFSLRHEADRGVPADRLTPVTDTDQLLDLVRFTEGGAFRPLRTADDLRRSWRFEAPEAAVLWQVLSLVYPGAVVAWHRLQTRSLSVLPYGEWAARQTAMYEVVRELSPATMGEVVHSLCARCLRSRLWRTDEESGSTLPVESLAGSAVVPCREPCTLFATRAREVAIARETAAAGAARTSV